jgi:acyl carrier protein
MTDVRELVISVAAYVLGVAPSLLAENGDLTRFPTYTSFRVLDIVESVEQWLTVEIDPDDLVPSNLRRVDTLCAMFTQSKERSDA